ncbi:MAG: protein kinase [Myxococcales bacterium]|nr:protein kinase [Myxococcales bacterium]
MLSALDRSLSKGTMLSEYRIEGTLGVGAFGVTYLATDTNLNLKVAIKEYLPAGTAVRSADAGVNPRSEMASEPFYWGLGRFLDESRALATFRHPNIVRVMRFFEANQTAYMVMEFVEGADLYSWAKGRRPFDEALVRRVILPLLDGLEVVHEASYLHRDIKPSNIFVRKDGSPVLIDFGAARMVRPDPSCELTAIVSPGYAPLEQYQTTGLQGPYSDLYALGGVMYWLVTGDKPLDAPGRVLEVMPSAVERGDRERFSVAFLRLVDWALAPEKHRRPQTVAELRSALRGASSSTATERVGGAPFPSSHEFPAAAPTKDPDRVPTSRSGVRLDEGARGRLEADLAKHVGPIASLLLKNAAKVATTPAAIVGLAAKEIKDDLARADFLRRHQHTATAEPVKSLSKDEAPRATFDAAALQRVEAELARVIGPVAKLIVKRAAATTASLQELCHKVAGEIDDERARARFLEKVSKGP